MPKTSIIMLVHDQLKITEQSIGSVIKYTDDYELIVFDNGSGPETRKYLETIRDTFPAFIRLIRSEENIGFIKANNQAAKVAKGDLICCLNNDVLVGKGWLSRMVQYLEKRPDVAQVGAKKILSAWMERKDSSGKDWGYIEGWCFVIPRSIYNKFGLFDEVNLRFAYCEDADLSYRLLEAGFKISELKIPAFHYRCTTRKAVSDTVDFKKIEFDNRMYMEKRWRVSKKKPIVSVIMPTYNPKPYIYEALNSILSCIYSPNSYRTCKRPVYEIIIINDGSTDPDSLKILDNLKSLGFKILNKRNGGISSARNMGIKEARGKYIFALDDDNHAGLEYMRKAVDVMEKDPSVMMVYSDCELFGDRTGVRRITGKNLSRIGLENCIDACAVYRKSMWETLGGYDETILGLEDWEFWLSGLAKGYKYYHIPEILFRYRVRKESKTYNYTAKVYNHIFFYIIRKHRKFYSAFYLLPKISLITPVYNPPVDLLINMLDSVVNQVYDNWELCIADGSTDPAVHRILEDYRIKYCRIKINFLDHNGGIVSNSNEAINMATGDYLALLDHDDTLTELALFEVVKAINHNPDLDILYSDETIIEPDRTWTYHKQEYSLFNIRRVNIFNHLTVYKKSLIDKVGPFKEGFEGAQDHELALRACEHAKKVIHLPKVLYNWKVTANSFTFTSEGKDKCNQSSKKALKEHFQRLGLKPKIERIEDTFSCNFTLPKSLLRPYIRKDLYYKTPIGDAILLTPVAKAIKADIECSGFVKELLKIAGAPVQQECLYKKLIDLNPLSSLNNVFQHPIAHMIWGSPEFRNKYGKMHITQIWGKVLGVKPDGVPRITEYTEIPEYKDKILLAMTARDPRRIWKYWYKLTDYLGKNKIPYMFLPGKCSARSLVDIIGSVKLMITTFTGPMHIRAALDKPQICLCVGDDPYLFAPLSDKAKVLWKGCSECFYCPPRIQGLRTGTKKIPEFKTVTCVTKKCHELVDDVIASIHEFEKGEGK